jgi:hypothetical protein
LSLIRGAFIRASGACIREASFAVWTTLGRAIVVASICPEGALLDLGAVTFVRRTFVGAARASVVGAYRAVLAVGRCAPIQAAACCLGADLDLGAGTFRLAAQALVDARGAFIARTGQAARAILGGSPTKATAVIRLEPALLHLCSGALGVPECTVVGASRAFAAIAGFAVFAVFWLAPVRAAVQLNAARLHLAPHALRKTLSTFINAASFAVGRFS